MTLIEVLIASFLTMILLTAVTFFYRQVTLMTKESEKLQVEQFKLAYLEKRLSNTIPKIISPQDINKDFYFFTSDVLSQDIGTSLVFTYDHKVSLDQNFSNHILARLFVEGHNLVLASWSSPKKWGSLPNLTMKKEILMENVSNLAFEFYVPPKRDRSHFSKTAKPIEIQPENSWHKTWKASYNTLPALIKIHLTRKIEGKEVPVVFAFSLPKSDMQILYEN